MFPESIKKKTSECLEKKVPFALFRFPGENEFHFDGQDDFSLLFNNFNCSFSRSRRLTDLTINVPADKSTDKEDYLEAVKEIAAVHKACASGKTVLSRTICGHVHALSVLDVAEKYFDMNEDAFCLLALFPSGHVFIMATPELLLKMKGKHLKTMALAGTRVLKSPEPWDQKNLLEHKIVSEYIQQGLERFVDELSVSEIQTLRSNNVEHLCTWFEARIKKDASHIEILDSLAPTPAVCGYPKNIAEKNIDRYENHFRGLYSGYTLVNGPDGDVSAFVNLRCGFVNLNDWHFTVFAGGGITADSVPESEWNETDLKADKLISLLTHPA